MAALVPFADLGMSAAIINVVASSASPKTEELVRRTLVSAFRVLLCSAAVLAAVGVVLTALNLWPALLGDGLLAGGSVAALACVLVFAITLPLGVGQRVLTGLGKNHVQILTQALAAPFILEHRHHTHCGGCQCGQLFGTCRLFCEHCGCVDSIVDCRSLHHTPNQARHQNDPESSPAYPGVNVMGVAWPMLIQMIALPAGNADRPIGAEPFGYQRPVGGIQPRITAVRADCWTIAASAVALWPMFAKARSADEIRSPFKLTAGFVVAGGLLAITLAALLPVAVPLISDGKVQLSTSLVVGFPIFRSCTSGEVSAGACT